MECGELKGRDVFEKDEDEAVILLLQLPVGGHSHLQTAPVAPQIRAADQTNGALAVVNALFDVVHNSFSHLKNIFTTINKLTSSYKTLFRSV